MRYRKLSVIGLVAVLLSCAASSRAQTHSARAPAQGRRAGAGAGSSQTGGQDRVQALAKQIQSLEERLAAVRAELDRLRHVADTRPELLSRLDRLEAVARKLREDLDALRLRQADVERDRNLVAKAMEEQRSRSWDIGYHGGVRFRSPGRRFSLKIKGFMVGRYRLGAVQTSDATADPEDGLDENGFALVHARLNLSGHVFTPKLRYAIQTELAGKPHLRKAALFIQPWSFLTLAIGQLKAPDSRQYLVSTSRLQLVDRGRAVKGFAHGYDVGITADFAFLHRALVLQVGLFNGAGANTVNDDTDLLYVLRVGTEPLGRVPKTEDDLARSVRPKIWIGGSAKFQKVDMGDLDGDGAMDKKQFYSLGAEAALYWRGFNLQTEFFAAIGRHEVDLCPTSYPASNRDCNKVDTHYGAYVQTGYVFSHGLQVSGRFSYAQVFDEGWSGDAASGTWKQSFGSLLPTPEGYRLDHVYEATGGLLYDPWGYHLRLGLIYSFQHESFLSNADSAQPKWLSRNLHLASLVARVLF